VAKTIKTKKMKNMRKKGVQKSSSNALAARAAALKKKNNNNNNGMKKRSTQLKEKPNSSAFGTRRAGGTDARTTSSSVFERSVAHFPKFDPESGSSTYGISSLSRKDHKRWTLDLRSDWRFFHAVSFVVNCSATLLLPAFTPEELERGLLFPEECSKLIELMCRLMFSEECEKEGEKEVVKETLTIGDWEGRLIWLLGELADENPDEFPRGNPLDAQDAFVDAGEAKMKKLKTFFSVDPMTRLDILCALCEDKAVQSEIVKEHMEDRAERARKVARILEMENERKKRKEKEKGQRKTPLKASTQTYFTHDATTEVLRDRDVHGNSVGTDSEDRYYFTLGDASPRVWRWDKLKEADAKEVFSYAGVEPAWQTISCTLEETEALAIVLERSSGIEDRELASYLKNAFIPLHARQRTIDAEAKKQREAKMKEQEAKEKREAEYRARENRKRSGRIAVKMIEQEQVRLEKIKQEKWESEKFERRRAALITMNDNARHWMFLPLRLREKTDKPAGLPVDAFVVQKGKGKPRAVLNRPDLNATFVSLKDLNKSTITRKNQRLFGMACVDNFFSILWPEDGGWYDGCVVSYDEATQEHFVAYEDGSTEHVNLDKQRIKYKHDVVVKKYVDEATNVTSYSWYRAKKSAAEKELTIDELMLEYVTGHHPGTVLALDTNVFDVRKFHRHKPTGGEDEEGSKVEREEDDIGGDTTTFNTFPEQGDKDENDDENDDDDGNNNMSVVPVDATIDVHAKNV
jgi:hypothetical protein